MHSDLALLRLLQLASPGLPVGGFTYSQGLEWAVEAGWVKDAKGFAAWQREQLHDTLGYLDWPLLARLYKACQADDADAFAHWSQFLLANRETAELRLEERQRGSALARLLDGWQLGQEPAWRASLELSQLGGMAWLGAYWSIPLRQLSLGHGFAWLEGAVMAGVKLVPFGQQAAQTLLRDLGEELPAVLDHALTLDDEQLGGGLPLLAIASSRHETQYTRLFRS
ncbi:MULTISPECIES: urease accessory protein UreF [unclassified Pseudomonas]|uniref:urease accessory protein UreF n=1 Tax=unclassified Pseudomonas TaxID=196821 RepID=UPI000C881758|nr:MULTISPECIES: urease accessory UreF family protein [unclassified Pseudomonas]PNA01106.1 urease accessory protein UreF [Pseudomonas sp. FW305-42]PNA25850.1 urease accessory protein UreF [Pseudomonas sp. MPR-R1B]PNB28040.1 urease accessory protein UreF [Pseudomonas sp. DP16D-E2]PNB44967.1 urease accessory protein UreF [Pseudomonas sp. FW305-17]PNB64047.1 urease accessory protein UreF [Pseudomonas sp. GW531-E2]